MKTGKNVKEAIGYIEKVNALARGEIVTVEGMPILAREVENSFGVCDNCPSLNECVSYIRDLCADVDEITRKTHQIVMWTNEREEDET